MKTQLSKMVKDFNAKAAIYNALENDCSKVHEKFLERWPLENLGEILTLENYVIGTGSRDTFCYWVERETRILGSMLGAQAIKFKVYYSKPKNSYLWVKRFSSADSAFLETNKSILDLLEAGQNNDFKRIKSNPLFKYSHLFRGKLLYLYFPEKYINIFSADDVEYFLDRLGIEASSSGHVFDNKIELIRFKENQREFKGWTNRKFSHFLYDQFVPPSRNNSSGEGKPTVTEKGLQKEEGKFILPKIKDCSLEVVEPKKLGSSESVSGNKRKNKKSRKPNYLAECLRNTKLGAHGEELVLDHEKRKLNGANRTDLAKRVKRVSLDDDSLGYDILSFKEKWR